MKKKLKKHLKANEQESLSSVFDVNGSYTGTPAYDEDSVPTQDADDL